MVFKNTDLRSVSGYGISTLSKCAVLMGLLIVLLLINPQVFAETKPNLVLLPVSVSESDQEFEADYGTALQEALGNHYQVFYGAEVEKQLELEYAKIDCSVESCNQNLAVAFNGELLADAAVKKISSGYLIRLRITNVLENQAVISKSKTCRDCDPISVIDVLLNILQEPLASKVQANEKPISAPERKDAQQISAKPKQTVTPGKAIPKNTLVMPIVRVEPRYPSQALREGIEGWVTLSFDVDKTGSVKNVLVLDAEPKRVFNRAAVNALSKWKYRPKVVNGQVLDQVGLETKMQFSIGQ